MKEQILALKKQGMKQIEIAKRVGCSPSTVTYFCNEEYRKKHVQDHMARRAKIKAEAVAYKGGKCERCEYDKCLEALDFHHLDPNEKEVIGALTRKSLNIEKLKDELDKCILVCCRCHREIHAGL